MRKQFQITLAMLVICLSLSSQTWYEVESGTDRELKTIQFISDEIGFIGGDSILLKTIDGGMTWNEMTFEFEDDDIFGSFTSLDVYDLHFFNENHGYIMSGLYGIMLETMDGGITWEAVDIDVGFCQVTSLHFINENLGYAGGGGCFEGHIILKYENGSWSLTEDPDDWSGGNYVTTVNFKNSELGFAGTVEGRVLRTTNGGALWDTIPNVNVGVPITDIDFEGDLVRMSHRNGIQAGSIISEDDGLTWEVDMSMWSFLYAELNALHTTADDIAFAGGYFPGSFTEENGTIAKRDGDFWNYALVDHSINDIGSHSGNNVFAVGENGAIYTNQQSISIDIITEQNEKLTIYPNPAFQGEDINLGKLNNPDFSIQILDTQGKEVSAKAFDGQFSKNTISSEGLRSGVYFVQFYNNDSNLLIETRRLVIK